MPGSSPSLAAGLGRALLSLTRSSRSRGQQLLLFRNSPLSVICNLVGLVGEIPLRVCVLYLSFSCVRALMSRALAASKEAMRFSWVAKGDTDGQCKGSPARPAPFLLWPDFPS